MSGITLNFNLEISRWKFTHPNLFLTDSPTSEKYFLLFYKVCYYLCWCSVENVTCKVDLHVIAIFADDYGLFQVAKMAFAVLSYEKNSQQTFSKFFIKLTLK